MLKSRRGLLAAGLAVVVVGAIGVASTLTAHAAQVPGGADQSADASASAVPAADTTRLTPPPTLPWGGRPTRIKKGGPGESSKALLAAGLVAAPNDPGTATIDFAPKGRTTKSTYLKSEQTDIKPPQPAALAATASASASASPSASASASPSATTATTTAAATTTAPTTAAAAAATTTPAAAATTTTPVSTGAPTDSASATPSASTSSDGTVHFLYNVGSQVATTDGLFATITVAKPTLGKEDYHSLAELAVESADGSQIVELGWNVDRNVNGDDDPHLFVYHWVNKASTCYNGCGYQQYSSTVKPGDTLAYGVSQKFGIQFYGGAWWVAFNSEYIGYFPATIWTAQGADFSQAGYVQVFGEVAASSDTPCTTQMGNGIDASQDTAAKMGSVSFLNGPTVTLNERSTTDVYPLVSLSGRTFKYGGPGGTAQGLAGC